MILEKIIILINLNTDSIKNDILVARLKHLIYGKSYLAFKYINKTIIKYIKILKNETCSILSKI